MFFSVRALVDTGAEVNIIRRGVKPENFFQRDSPPLNLRGANETKLKGGNLCIKGRKGSGRSTTRENPVCPPHILGGHLSPGHPLIQMVG